MHDGAPSGHDYRVQSWPDREVGIMKNHCNIEKSGFKSGAYIGYSQCGTWRIEKNQCGWRATLRSGQIITNLPFAPALITPTLCTMSEKLKTL